jgi:dTMP kinase
VLGTLRPHLTLILDLPVDAGLRREQQRGGTDRYARMGVKFHQRVREAFLDIAAHEPARCIVIDATQAIDAVAAAVWRAVEERLL